MSVNDDEKMENRGIRLYGDTHKCSFCGAEWPQKDGWENHRCQVCEHAQIAAACDRCRLAAERAKVERLREALRELVEVATLRGDNDLPHPSNDTKVWTARMQSAWDDADAVLRETLK